MEQPHNIEDLFKRYLLDQCSAAEIQLLAGYFSTGEHEDILKDIIRSELGSSPETDSEPSPELRERLGKIFLNLLKRIQKGNDL